MSRRLLPCLMLLALLAVPAMGQGAFKTGVSDQVPSSFLNPFFQPLGFSAARYIAPYDVMNQPAGSPQRVALSSWVANSGGQHLIIAFAHSHTPRRDRHVPTVADYTTA